MEKLIVQSPAKINLDFKILGKRPDGYHDIVSTVQVVDLCDTITFRREPIARITGAVVSADNLIVKAVRALELVVGKDLPCHIHLDKSIPIGAGLGGGSSNAAATLQSVNLLYGLCLTSKHLQDIGAGLGSDVPLFLQVHEGNRFRISGRGEIVTPVASSDDLYVIFRPHKRLSSREAYEEWDRTGQSFADQAWEKVPWLDEIFELFPDAVVSGKGPTVFVKRNWCEYDDLLTVVHHHIAWNGDVFMVRGHECLVK